MAKANANTVSDGYAEEGTTVTRAVGDVKEVITADVSSDEIDKDVPGQTPAELKKSGQPVGEEVRKPTAFNQMQGEEPSRVGDDEDRNDEPEPQLGQTVETAPGGGVTEDQAATAKTVEERKEELKTAPSDSDEKNTAGGDSQSAGSSSARSSRTSPTTSGRTGSARRS